MRPFHESGLNYVLISDGFKMFSLPNGSITTFEDPMALINKIAEFVCYKEGQWTEDEASFIASAINLQSTAALCINFDDGLTVPQEICARWTFLSLLHSEPDSPIHKIAALVMSKPKAVRQLTLSYEESEEWKIDVAQFHEDEKVEVVMARRHAV